MARYRFTINTDSYRCARCSVKNWEPGTRNDYMISINGKRGVENGIREVRWLLDLFQGISWQSGEWSESNPSENCGLSDRYVKWLGRKAHNVKYMDRLCGFERKQHLSGYGWMQGYFDRQAKIDELLKNGAVIIPFKVLYDSRQYERNMDGCYMKIERIA